MAPNTYGQTWQGKRWLNALNDIDMDNRLPRGRTYANKGAVTEFMLKGNEIHARVRGSYPEPYKAVIRIPAIAQKDALALTDAVAEDYGIVAGLLNRELSPAVADAAERLGIPVFPSRWEDLEMRCSCPDYANPCKHLAAVIYVLTREIDADPFLVFSLRGIDLARALRGRNMPEEAADDAPPALRDALMTEAGGGAADIAYAPGAELPDFAALRDLSDTLTRLLPASPVFYHAGDFRAVYIAALKRAAKEARKLLKSAFNDIQHAPFTCEDKPHILISEDYEVTVEGMAAALPRYMTVFDAAAYLHPERLNEYQPETAALHYLYMTALQLLAHGAAVPGIVADGAHGARIRWLPATLDTGIADAMRRLAALLPPGLAAFGKEKARFSAEGQATALCSLFLDGFIRSYSGAPRKICEDNEVYRLFFSVGRAACDTPATKHIPPAIMAWTSRLRIAAGRYVPVVCLEDAGGGDFLLSLAVEGAGLPFTPLAEALDNAGREAERLEMLKNVMLLAEFFPPVRAYVSGRARAPARIAAGDFPAFLFDTLPVIRLLGVRAVLPKGLDRVIRPRLTPALSRNGESVPSGIVLKDMLSFRWKIAVGDTALDPEGFEALVRDASGIVRIRDEYVFLDPAEIDALRKRLERPPALTGVEALQAALAEEYQGAAVFLDDSARAVIRRLTETGGAPPPAGLNADLRPYQLRGYRWLYRNAAAGLGSIIADDMGLGKTLQVIAALLKLKEDGALTNGALVAAPAGLLTNWHKEIARFAPGLSVAVYHGAGREERQAKHCDIVLTTYGMARGETALFRKKNWDAVVADEAQHLKNPAAQQTKALKSLRARCFIAMSGTPVENRLSDYWSIMDFANRGYLGTLSRFIKDIADPIRIHRDMHTVERFRKVTAPFLLRRLKSDKSVITDLPDKIEQNRYCDLTEKQAALYETVLRKALRTINEEEDGFTRQGLVLQMILALKQICNHPAQYSKQGKKDAALSGKAVCYLALLDEIYAAGEKTLVFTQFTETGKALVEWARERFGKEPLFLHGGLSRARRDELTDRFTNDRTDRVFILSLKAGGTGLNLTAASNVIHYDLWWNPAVEAQATDRAYRIGQSKNVQIHRFITRATFEERIDDMIQAKRDLADLTVGTGESWVGHLNNDELNDLFSLKKAV